MYPAGGTPKIADIGGEDAHLHADHRVVGMYYNDGQGVPQDTLLAYFWWSLSATRITGEDYNRCAIYRDYAAKQLPPEQLMKAQQMTREWEAKHPRK